MDNYTRPSRIIEYNGIRYEMPSYKRMYIDGNSFISNLWMHAFDADYFQFFPNVRKELTVKYFTPLQKFTARRFNQLTKQYLCAEANQK